MMGGEHINYDCFPGLLEVLWQGAHHLHLLMSGTESIWWQWAPAVTSLVDAAWTTFRMTIFFKGGWHRENPDGVFKPISGIAKLRPEIQIQLLESPRSRGSGKAPLPWSQFPLAWAFVPLIKGPKLSENAHAKPYCLPGFLWHFSQEQLNFTSLLAHRKAVPLVVVIAQKTPYSYVVHVGKSALCLGIKGRSKWSLLCDSLISLTWPLRTAAVRVYPIVFR